jgi:hypothetical protein
MHKEKELTYILVLDVYSTGTDCSRDIDRRHFFCLFFLTLYVRS